MATEHLTSSKLPRALSDVVADLADLVQKEVRLARTELSENVLARFRAGMWFSIAGSLGLVAAFLVLQAIVFGIASLGLPLHWAFLVVAAAVAGVAAVAYLKGRSDAQREVLPTRSIHQVEQDISVAKEHLT
jgi:hypothetical protein